MWAQGTAALVNPCVPFIGTVTKFKWMENYSNMALLKMSTVDEATTALTKLHAHNVRDRKLRVCFSRSVIRDGVAPEESGDQGFC